MSKRLGCALLLFAMTAPAVLAQDATTRDAGKAKAAESDPLKGMFGGAGKSKQPTGPITTEVYSDEAFFDSAKYIGTFTGRVIVKDPRFNIQADKLTVYLTKGGEGRGLERAVAEGNVGVIREQPGENGGPPSRAVGRADLAIYTAADGNVELRGTPRLQSGVNTHIATSPDTVMIVNESGQLTTKGPSRTELRQEAKPPEPPKP